MTVSELIAKLAEYPSDAPVLIHSSNDCGLSNIDVCSSWVKPSRIITDYIYSSEHSVTAIQAVLINED